jgi:hypothetical protein
VTVPSHGRIRTGIHARLGTVPDSDRDLVDGLPCTSVSRTALDVARFRPLHESLVVMDPAVARCGAEEKRREDALRGAGFTVVRWTSDELWRTPDVPLARVRTALTR